MAPVYRFAPSPTGFLHVGGARTAIFNWLFARKTKGKFLLRIEDTDRKRSTPEFIDQIQKSLEWLGVKWDKPPLFQSSRLERHREVVNQLLQVEKAYPCFCKKEDLERKRQAALARKAALRYDGTCRDLTMEEKQQKLSAGIPFVIRLKTSKTDVVFEDEIHGKVKTSGNEIDDFVILRSDGTPIYQIAVVVDDHDMGVTHIIRGDDHLSNTPKQILLYQSLDWSVPVFGHLPLILGPDRNRLSKRHGATAVEEFRDQGILAAALFNYLCLLGWSPGNDREIMPLDELITSFEVKRINKANAIFDHQKLLWMNSKYLAALTSEQLLQILIPEVSEKYHEKLIADGNNARLLMDMLRERCKTSVELAEGAAFYFEHPSKYDQKGVEKYFNESSILLLEKIREVVSATVPFDAETLEAGIRKIADEEEIGAGKMIHPLRLALTGKTNSPGIFDVLEVLGKTAVLHRIGRAIEYIDNFKKT